MYFLLAELMWRMFVVLCQSAMPTESSIVSRLSADFGLWLQTWPHVEYFSSYYDRYIIFFSLYIHARSNKISSSLNFDSSLSFISEFNLHHHLLASTPPSSTVPSIHLGLSTKTQVTSFQTSGFIFRKSQMTQKSMLQSLDINGHLPRAREHLNTEQSLSELALKPERRELVI